MAPKSASSQVRLTSPRPTQLTQWERLEAFRKEGILCDLCVKSSDGKEFRVHAVVLALASEKLRKQLEQAGNGGASRELAAGIPGDALAAVLDFVYSGEARVDARMVPEVARMARRWELTVLQETLVSSLSGEDGTLTPEVVAGLFALGEPFGEQLGAAARAFVLANFSACAQTEPFFRWPQKVLEHLLKSDHLVVASEEEALTLVARWCRFKDGREEGAVAALAAVRWPLLSASVLDALAAEGKVALAGTFRAAVAERSAAARDAHNGLSDASNFASLVPHVRQAYAGWWAGLGSSARGGLVIAGKGAEGKAPFFGSASFASLVPAGSTFAMAGLEERYQKAVAWESGKTMPNDRKLLCYGFFKQAAVGDVDGDQPYAVQFEKRSKWDAWNAVKGMSKEEAMKNYIEELEKQIKDFDPQNPGF
ncbi:unnamed protein product [Polarella glacialis]|uniref:Uncharacterized protein n=1 Tax=Polarella glacialis TaxID=89957 RepID=A0A813K951_POLGL|nr:unnamed protein product [Polarella glacialis]